MGLKSFSPGSFCPPGVKGPTINILLPPPIQTLELFSPRRRRSLRPSRAAPLHRTSCCSSPAGDTPLPALHPGPNPSNRGAGLSPGPRPAFGAPRPAMERDLTSPSLLPNLQRDLTSPSPDGALPNPRHHPGIPLPLPASRYEYSRSAGTSLPCFLSDHHTCTLSVLLPNLLPLFKQLAASRAIGFATLGCCNFQGIALMHESNAGILIDWRSGVRLSYLWSSP